MIFRNIRKASKITLEVAFLGHCISDLHKIKDFGNLLKTHLQKVLYAKTLKVELSYSL